MQAMVLNTSGMIGNDVSGAVIPTQDEHKFTSSYIMDTVASVVPDNDQVPPTND